MDEPRKKSNYIGAPAVFALEMACQQINDAFGVTASYVVGSSNERADWRDIDVRMIMSDDKFADEFPGAAGTWELHPKWLLLTCAISAWLSKQTGLPVDFQFQPRTHANTAHKGARMPVGRRVDFGAHHE